MCVGGAGGGDGLPLASPPSVSADWRESRRGSRKEDSLSNLKAVARRGTPWPPWHAPPCRSTHRAAERRGGRAPYLGVKVRSGPPRAAARRIAKDGTFEPSPRPSEQDEFVDLMDALADAAIRAGPSKRISWAGISCSI